MDAVRCVEREAEEMEGYDGVDENGAELGGNGDANGAETGEGTSGREETEMERFLRWFGMTAG